MFSYWQENTEGTQVFLFHYVMYVHFTITLCYFPIEEERQTKHTTLHLTLSFLFLLLYFFWIYDGQIQEWYTKKKLYHTFCHINATEQHGVALLYGRGHVLHTLKLGSDGYSTYWTWASCCDCQVWMQWQEIKANIHLPDLSVHGDTPFSTRLHLQNTQ